MIFGPDVSDFQGVVDWAAVRASGRLFGFTKATEGRTFVAETFGANRTGMAAAGMVLRGIYHFARPDRNSAANEATHFLTTTGSLDSGEVAVLDLESGNIGHAETGAWALAWLEAVEKATGRTPWVYSYASFLADFDTSALTRFPLWIAGYGPNDGQVPEKKYRPGTDRWPRAIVWQYTSAASVPGVAGQCDDNLFEGTAVELAALAAGSVRDAPVIPTPVVLQALVILQEELLDSAHPELARRFRAGCRRFGGEVRVNSVLRDSALQRVFFDCAAAKKKTGRCPPGCERSNCAPANPPGTSNHEPHGAIQKSLAIDAEPVDGNWPDFQAALRAEGLLFPISTEDWHVQCQETPAASYEAGSEDRLPAAPSEEDALFSPSPIRCLHLIAAQSGLLLTSAGDTHGSPVTQEPANGSLNQRWQIVGHDDGTVSYVNRAGDLALDRPDYKTDPGTMLQVARTEYNAAQRWQPDELKDGRWRLWAPGTNRCLDVSDGSKDPGAALQLWTGNDQPWQSFGYAFTI